MAMIIGKRKRKQAAPKLFGMMVSVILVVTLYLVASTVYLNSVSYTKGPVHWHADFEIWDCGRPVVAHNSGDEADELADPTGFLSNKVGSPTIHEHDDRRMHIEGVLLEKHEGSLGNFFEQIGGDLHKDRLLLPERDKFSGAALLRMNGDLCGDESGEVQVFVNQIKDRKLVQTKLEDPENYVISPFGAVPPGDCIIIEFDRPKASTDKTCVSYDVAKQTGKVDQ